MSNTAPIETADTTPEARVELAELHRWATDDVELVDAAATVFRGRPAVAFLHGRQPVVARWDGEMFVGPTSPTELSGIYRADVFDSTHHLRWYRPQGRGASRTVVLTEHPEPLTGFDDHESVGCRRLPQHYLLWPPALPTQAPWSLPPGWCWTGDARTAVVALPVDHDPQVRTQLDTNEYIVVDPVVTDEVDGNAYIIDERFVGLRPHGNSRSEEVGT